MFWNSVVASLKFLTHWETYVAGLEYVTIFIPTAIVGMIMQWSTAELPAGYAEH